MKIHHPWINRCITASSILLIFLLTGCTQPSQDCRQQPQADLSRVLAYAADDQLSFQFPLDQMGGSDSPRPATFCTGGGNEYHAAEDYHLPAGTPVYAIADGEISFSGPMDGYGWLIIIDHPQENLYSLYGHLSPSREKLESGPVQKGDLIAYLGDPDENGGSPEKPLRTHLHFGIRAGQRNDYPGMGEWRWMAGWIKPCPQNVGWLNPSKFLTSQVIPPGGFQPPSAGLIEKWVVELALTSVYLVCGAFAILFVVRRNDLKTPIIFGSLMILAGWMLSTKATRVNLVLFSMAILSYALAVFIYIRTSREKRQLAEG